MDTDERPTEQTSLQKTKKWRDKLQNLLYKKDVCCVCLSEVQGMNHWDAVYHTEHEKTNKTLKDIIKYTFGCSIINLLSTSYICEKCVTLILEAYLMIKKVKSNHIILEQYINILLEQVKLSTNSELTHEKELMLTIDNVNSLNVPSTITVAEKQKQKTNNITQIFLCEVVVEPEFVDWDVESNTNILKYECPYCGKQFNKYNSFTNHYKQHNEMYFRCHKCSKRFKDFEEIIKHRNNIHADNLFTCNICQIILLSENSKEHEEKHTKNLICDICQIQFDNETYLTNHIKESHMIITCQHCFKTFSTELKLHHHRCLFNCLECKGDCIHEQFLSSYREQHMANQITFQCCYCDFQYTTRSQLIAHANEEHLQHFPYLCDLCGQSFASRPLLTNHMYRKHASAIGKDEKTTNKNSVVSKDNAYECNLCGFCLFTEEAYRIHRKRHLSGETECQYCKKIFYNIGRLNMHIAKDHPDKNKRDTKAYKCSMCPLDFEFRVDYLKHLSMHPKGSEHICRECNVSYDLKQSYLCHLRRHRLKYDRECPICFKMYTLQTIQRHMRIHMRENGKIKTPTSCDLCGKLFLNDKAFIKHSKNHKEEKQCPHCEKFVKTAFFSKHLTIHEDKEKPMNKCSECDYETRFPMCLQAHINRHHLKVRPYQCSICNKTFYSEYTLKGHQIVHRDERQEHVCHICGKKFISTKALTLHNRIHTGETPYPCELCELSFLSASRRRQHMIRKHFEPSIECHICQKKLYTQSDLRRHMRKCHDVGPKRKGNDDVEEKD